MGSKFNDNWDDEDVESEIHSDEENKEQAEESGIELRERINDVCLYLETRKICY